MMTGDEGKRMILDALEACLIAGASMCHLPSATFTRVHDDDGPMIVHLEGVGRYQVTIDKEAS